MDATTTPDDLIPLAEARLLIPSPRPGKRTNLATVYRLIDSGELPAWKRGRWLFVSRADVLGLVEGRGPVKRTPTVVAVSRATAAGLKRHGLA